MIIPAEREFGEFYVDESLRITLPPGETVESILGELRADGF